MPLEANVGGTRGEQTRQAILDAAERLFLSNGFNGTSVRQIAHEAGGIAVGGIYNHFSSKEEIFRALLEARNPYSSAIDIIDSLDAESGPALIHQAFTRLESLVTENSDFFRLVMIDIQEFEGSTIRALASQVVPHMVRLGQEAQAAGGMRKDVSVFVLTRCFAMMMIGYVLTQLVAFSHGRNVLAEMIELPLPDAGPDFWIPAILDVFLYGVAEREDRA